MSLITAFQYTDNRINTTQLIPIGYSKTYDQYKTQSQLTAEPQTRLVQKVT